MSAFDFEKLLAAAEADLDAAARARVKEALTAAVEATEEEARRRATEVSTAILERHAKQLEALKAQAMVGAKTDADNLVEAHRDALKGLEAEIRRVETDATSAARSVASGVSAARGVEAQIRAASSEASQAAKLIKAEQTKAQEEIETLKAHQRQMDDLLKKGRALVMTVAVLAVLGITAAIWVGATSGQRSAQNAYAAEFARLEQVAQGHEARIAELVEQENTAFAAATDMADLRDQIGTELNRLREVQEEIGLELVRDDSVIEVRLGDVILRPWRGQTLVIIDEGRRLEAFSGGASLNGLGNYVGRMFRTRPAG